MGLSDIFSEVLASLSFTEVHAEAPADEDSNDGDEGKGEEGDEEQSEGGEEGGDDADGGEDEAEDEEEEEEEEEEPEDIKGALEEECANSAQCHDYKHHYDECVDRVTNGPQTQPGYKGFKEDCVEEFFHLSHCATSCAAPKLFKQLK